MHSRSKASTRQAARASLTAIALHFADGGARVAGGEDDGGSYARQMQQRLTTAEERRVRRRLDQLEKTNLVDLPFKEFKDGLSLAPAPLKPSASAESAATDDDDDMDVNDPPRPSKRARPTPATTKSAAKSAATAPAPAPPPPPKTTMTSSVRTLLAPSNRRTLTELLADQPHQPYIHSTVRPSQHPPRKFCLPCGSLLRYACQLCGEGVCSLACRQKHDEDACGRG